MTSRGCGIDDPVCGTPAAATRNVVLGLGASLASDGTTTTARASLRLPDASVVARGETPVPDPSDAAVIAAAIDAAVDAAVESRRRRRPPTASATTSSRPTASPGDPPALALDFPCNLMRGMEAVGARCLVDRRRIRTEPHGLNVQRHPEEIPRSEVASFSAFAALGLTPTGLRIHLKNGDTRDVVVSDRDRRLEPLRSLLR